MKSFADIQERAVELERMYSGRDTLFQQMEDMYFLVWDEADKIQRKQKNLKVTLSPDPRNQIDGAIRLLIATDPIWSIEQGEDKSIKDVADQLERACGSMWSASGKIGGTPIHYDAIKSGMLYDEAHIAILPTYELAKMSTDKRVLRAAKRTPYLYEVYNPRQCYPVWDRFGLAEHLRKVDTKVGRVMGDYGAVAEEALKNRGSEDQITLEEYWSIDIHCVWIDETDTPLILEEHGLDFIPIVASMLYGSPTLYYSGKYSESRTYLNQPFLYTLLKSDLWRRQNLALTVAYTMLFSIGANPMFLFKRATPDKKISLDWSKPGGVVYLDQNEEFGPLVRQVIDPAMQQLLSIAEGKIAESTIFKQALGQPIGAGATFSETALLNQAGRLPLVMPQKKLSWLFGQAMEISIQWLKKDKKQYKYKTYDIDLAAIPEDLEVGCALDIALPQDRLQQANVAGSLTGGDDPLASKEWARRNLLNIENNQDEQKRIWIEKAGKAKYDLYVQEQVAIAQEEMRQAIIKLQSKMQQPPPQPGMQGQPAPEMMPPEMGGQAPPMQMPPENMTMPPTEPIPSPGMPMPGGPNGPEPV